MAIDQDAQQSANPVGQLTKTMTAITDALKVAGEKASAGNQEIARAAMSQAQDNAGQLMETLKALVSQKDPTAVAAAYAKFVTESAQKHGQQLLEISQLMAQTSKDVWGTVVGALTKAARPPAR